ncbi:MAG: ABC transporter permease [Ginsengibacter sp.]
METVVPTVSAALTALLRADFTTQWRNRRSSILVLLVPVIILISWKGIIDKMGGPFALSSCITIGLIAIGLMGYSNAIARDRDKGVFQRLRVTPVPAWCIMVSRLIVQLVMIMILTTIVFLAGYYYDGITISTVGYALAFVAAIIGGAVYLGLGQLIAGLLKNAETVNSTTRLVYFLFIMVGMLGDLGVLGNSIKDIVQWSPYGTVKNILSVSMEPWKWNNHTSIAFLVTILYAVFFSLLGIKKFKWNSK